jgi:hypothetical protein
MWFYFIWYLKIKIKFYLNLSILKDNIEIPLGTNNLPFYYGKHEHNPSKTNFSSNFSIFTKNFKLTKGWNSILQTLENFQ